MTDSVAPLNWADIVGIAGFVLIIGKIVWDWWRYRSPLSLHTDGMSILWHENNQSLVWFRVVFVNRSSRSKTVCKMGNMIPVGTEVLKAEHQVSPGHETVVYLSPKGKNACYSEPIPISEGLQLPLDILPGQSQARYCAVVFHWGDNWAEILGLEEPFDFGISAFEVGNKKPIAKWKHKVTLKMLQNVGVYTFLPDYPYAKLEPSS